MKIEIREVISNKELKTFIKFPFSIYKGNPYWIPPLSISEQNTLRRDKNPAFEHSESVYFLAYADGKIVGRIAGIINHKEIEKLGERHARFGWVEFVDDKAVSKALFEAVEQWASSKQMTFLKGPFGFTNFDKTAMLVEGFDSRGTMSTIYNPPYYPEHLQALGYEKMADWLELESRVPEKLPDRISRFCEVIKKRYSLRVLDIKNTKEILSYSDELFDLINETYEEIDGFVPFSKKQMEAYSQQFLKYINKDLMCVILDKNEKLVAFAISTPSYSEALQKARGRLFPFGFLYLMLSSRRNKRVDMNLIGVTSEYRNKGLNTILIDYFYRGMKKIGAVVVDSNPELEHNNNVLNLWKDYDTTWKRRRRCFIKKL